MLPRDHGSIVNVGSALAYEGIPLQSAYCAAKFACRGFFESTRAELIRRGTAVRLSMVHLPGLNTPQFSWCRSVFDRHPQPVPPIYQPEVAAKFVVRAALDGRRSKIVGSWNKLLVAVASAAPGVANQFAARGAWETQLTDQPVRLGRPDDLDAAVDGDEDYGAHGVFDGRSRGVLDPSFLRSLPETAGTAGRAVAASLVEKAAVARARRAARADSVRR
jgi:NAD(P)-dependent dehydrogenase (short-subunit alcohol dehydrogenase family)